MDLAELLTKMIWLPILCGLIVCLLALLRSKWTASAGLFAVIGEAVLLLELLSSLKSGGRWLFSSSTPLISLLGVTWSLSLDGFGLMMVILSVVATSVAAIWEVREESPRPGVLAGLLVSEGALIGAILSTDLLIFYLFWELMLIPMFFMIGLYGGANRFRAAITFVIYTVVGSSFMLAAIMTLALAHGREFGALSTSLFELSKLTSLSSSEQLLIFAGLAVGFLVKTPLFPLHSWLPLAYEEAPTSGAIVMASVMGKIGLLGYSRFVWGLVPGMAGQYASALLWCAAIGSIYAALVAWSERKIIRVVAFSSLSHVNICALGVLASPTLALAGSIFQMLSHGLVIAVALMLCQVMKARFGITERGQSAGLASHVPWFSVLFMLMILLSVALPPSSSFVGEFVIFTGLFKSFPWHVVTVLLSVILGAVYMLSLGREVLFGEPRSEIVSRDLSAIELLLMLPLVLFAVWLGVRPGGILSLLGYFTN